MKLPDPNKTCDLMHPPIAKDLLKEFNKVNIELL